MKHVVAFCFVILLSVIGTAVIAVDLYHNLVLHTVSAVVGSAFLCGAIGLALPVQLGEVLKIVGPYIPAFLRGKSEGG